jgi:hypothetical protein
VKIIHIRPSKRFRYHWESFESEGVEPTFAGKRDALDYAQTRFRGAAGEIHVYDDAGENVVEKIHVTGL